MNTNYNIITSTDDATVVAEYSPLYRVSADYQSESGVERDFISQLIGQGYEYLPINNESTLIANLRSQIEKLNRFRFSDGEWERFFSERIANANEGVVEKTRKIQDDHIQILKRDDGSTKNVYLLDKKNIHNNRLQVINQYQESGGERKARYDVTVLVNGLPLVHVELKRRGVALREAFNQIKRYQRDSFWAAGGLYEYVQVFVISNGTNTKYYSNTTRNAHIKELENCRKSKKTSNSFEFTSYWADANNEVIADLIDFTKTFFAKHTLLNILTRYCVFTSQELLLVMRPYQIAATEKILRRIAVSSNYKTMGTVEAGGYIWHTTGSGKTLTSFKTAQLATGFEGIDKVLFVVDRKDLDYQTMKEYDRFQKGAANASASTKELGENLENPGARIVVTTIQKLDIFVSKHKTHDIYKKHIVIIFDECHRSQFGDMRRKIVKAFKKYHIFGFTGTPIFADNAGSGGNPLFRTTEQAFGEKLHTYTIVDAINDGNVLPFRIDFINTVKSKDDIPDKNVRAIDIDGAMGAPERIREVVAYILEHFDQKTKRNAHYTIEGKRMAGFNSIFAVSSIQMAMKYYEEFKKQIAEKNGRGAIYRAQTDRAQTNHAPTIATIFSYSANEDDPEDALPDEGFENDRLDKTSRDFLEAAIVDYNSRFNTNYDTSSDSFQNYYKDLSLRVKNREVDLLIVVNMFLTGFDATTLNTLWVDKNLKQHGLIQAFSRTNRILNSVKTFGNIVCFRDLKQATDDAIALFGNKNAGGVVLLKTYKDYYYGYDENGTRESGYAELIAELAERFPLGKRVVGEEAKKDFIRLFGVILRLKNILTAFDDFAGNEILSERDFQDYQSLYLDLHQEFRKDKDLEKENINDDIVFELELIRQIEINIDYILMLVEKYQASKCEDKNILVTISKAIGSSMELRSKKELIEDFIERVNLTSTNGTVGVENFQPLHPAQRGNSNISDDWQSFVYERKEKDLSALIDEEKLKSEETRRFIDNAFRDGALKTTGMDIDKILPPMPRFGGGNRDVRKRGIIEKLMIFFERYLGLV